jgi:hypothetical protein
MQMMTQFIQASASNNNNNNHPPPPPPPPPQVDRLARFLRLRPNKFSSATEPIVADDWLRSVNKDLVTCECTDAEKVRFTAHLLEGPAAMWWETYQITHPIDGLDWDTFREGFPNAHISSGTINVKKDEFRSLRQGGRTLKEYMDDFCALSRYAPDDIDTDAKRKEKFLNGHKGDPGSGLAELGRRRIGTKNPAMQRRPTCGVSSNSRAQFQTWELGQREKRRRCDE